MGGKNVDHAMACISWSGFPNELIATYPEHDPAPGVFTLDIVSVERPEHLPNVRWCRRCRLVYVPEAE